eukprot:839913_1
MSNLERNSKLVSDVRHDHIGGTESLKMNSLNISSNDMRAYSKSELLTFYNSTFAGQRARFLPSNKNLVSEVALPPVSATPLDDEEMKIRSSGKFLPPTQSRFGSVDPSRSRDRFGGRDERPASKWRGTPGDTDGGHQSPQPPRRSADVQNSSPRIEDRKEAQVPAVAPGFEPEPAPAPSEWWYLDPKLNVQGPFAAEAMAQWYCQNYFDLSLKVRSSRMPEGAFRSLKDLFDCRETAFLTWVPDDLECCWLTTRTRCPRPVDRTVPNLEQDALERKQLDLRKSAHGPQKAVESKLPEGSESDRALLHRMELQRIEDDRIRLEKIENERRESERRESERKEREFAHALALKRKENERIENERLQNEHRENERRQSERRENERRESERIELERVERARSRTQWDRQQQDQFMRSSQPTGGNFHPFSGLHALPPSQLVPGGSLEAVRPPSGPSLFERAQPPSMHGADWGHAPKSHPDPIFSAPHGSSTSPWGSPLPQSQPISRDHSAPHTPHSTQTAGPPVSGTMPHMVLQSGPAHQLATSAQAAAQRPLQFRDSPERRPAPPHSGLVDFDRIAQPAFKLAPEPVERMQPAHADHVERMQPAHAGDVMQPSPMVQPAVSPAVRSQPERALPSVESLSSSGERTPVAQLRKPKSTATQSTAGGAAIPSTALGDEKLSKRQKRRRRAALLKKASDVKVQPADPETADTLEESEVGATAQPAVQPAQPAWNTNQNLWDSGAVKGSEVFQADVRITEAQRRAEARARAWGTGVGSAPPKTLQEIQSEQAHLDSVQREQTDARRKIMEAQQATIAQFEGDNAWSRGVQPSSHRRMQSLSEIQEDERRRVAAAGVPARSPVAAGRPAAAGRPVATAQGHWGASSPVQSMRAQPMPVPTTQSRQRSSTGPVGVSRPAASNVAIPNGYVPSTRQRSATTLSARRGEPQKSSDLQSARKAVAVPQKKAPAPKGAKKAAAASTQSHSAPIDVTLAGGKKRSGKKRRGKSKASPFGGPEIPDEFRVWCKQKLQNIKSSDGVFADFALIEFVMTLNTDSDVRQYLSEYLGTSDSVKSFTSDFLTQMHFYKGSNGV